MLRSIAFILIGLCLGVFGCGRTQQPELAVVPVPTSEPTAAPTAAPPLVLRELDLDVNGIRSGTAYEDIVKKIGKPERFKDFGLDECSDRQMRTIYYQGLTIELEGDHRKRNFAVVSIKVTSQKWLMGTRVRIGSTRDEVLQAFGPAHGEDPNDLVTEHPALLNYVTKENLGIVSFSFANGRLTEVIMQETLC